MNAIELAGWGSLGGLVIEVLDLAASVRKHKTWPWHMPEEMRFLPYLYCALTRPFVGGVVAVALGLTNQVSGEWGLLLVGAGAPLIIANASKQFGQTRPEVAPASEAAAAAGPGPEPTADLEAESATEPQLQEVRDAATNG